MRIEDCVPRIDWFGIGLGLFLMFVGVMLTLTWVGAIVGVPLFLASLELVSEGKTLLGTPCAPKTH